MHPQAEALATQFKKDFFAADHSIKWTAAEQESHIWLDDRTVLAGTIDARGETEDGDKFFADWKTIGVRSAGKNNASMPSVKLGWRMDPQALSYGLLVGANGGRFTVRWAIKSNPPTTDFEWYSYTQAECDWWKGEVLAIAEDIRSSRLKSGNWQTNLTSCSRYGWNLRCPLYDNGCSKLNFNHHPNLPPRDHHADLEYKIRSEFSGQQLELVVLSSSSIELWLSCQEKYRRFYEGVGMTEDSEALTIGKDFHKIIESHIRSLINVSPR